jgi:hypothetical protein
MKHFFRSLARRDKGQSVWFGVIGLLILLTVISSCNNDADNQTTTDSSGATTLQTTMEGQKLVNFEGNFPYLTLSRADLERFFTPVSGGGIIQKVVFRFQFENPTSLPSLVAFQAKNIRSYEVGPLTPALTKETLTLPITGEFILGNLEMSRTMYTNLITSAGNSTLLIFTPSLSERNVTYKVRWGGTAFNLTDSTARDTATIDDGLPLNPSPPDPPFGGD